MKFIFGIILTTVFIVGGLIYLESRPTEAKVYSRENMLRADTAILGNKDTKVYLVEFSDFQCPACKAFKPVVDELIKKYPNQIVFGYRHYPLPQHPYAEKAAYAAEAAGKQGKFWEMYDYLFEHQATISETTISDGAKVIGLTMEEFERDMSSDSIHEKIQEDKRDAFMFGVNSTPTFFLNGKKLKPANPNNLLQLVEKELQNNE